MLYVSAADRATGTATSCEQFDRDYDQERYEKKIARLIKQADIRFRTENPEERNSWRAATRLVSETDHYLGVMIVRANVRPPWDFLKLVTTAIAIVCALLAFIVLLVKNNIGIPSREALGFYFWTIIISLALAYSLVRFILGKERFENFIGNLSQKVFRPTRKIN